MRHRIVPIHRRLAIVPKHRFGWKMVKMMIAVVVVVFDVVANTWLYNNH